MAIFKTKTQTRMTFFKKLKSFFGKKQSIAICEDLIVLILKQKDVDDDYKEEQARFCFYLMKGLKK